MTAQIVHPVNRSLRSTQPLKTKILVTLEVLAVFALMLVLRVAMRATGIYQWEKENLGWVYTVMLLWIGLTALVIRLSRRSWSEFGVSSAQWPNNLDIGIKAYLVRFIPIVFGGFAAAWLGLTGFGSAAYQALIWAIALAVMVWVLNRHTEVKSGRANILATMLLLLVPIGVGLATGKLNLMIASTILWQFVFSGFGEEFIHRGYFQSRLNHAFGRPAHLSGIQFGVGLVMASFMFGLLHVVDSYDPRIGFSSLAWELLLGNFIAGLFLGVIREKTGTLLAPSFAHGLPDAVGEPLIKIFGWESIF